jgi:hypothetical protein
MANNRVDRFVVKIGQLDYFTSIIQSHANKWTGITTHETWPELAFTVSSFSLEIEKEEVEVNTSSLAVCRKVQRVNIVGLLSL